MIGHAGELYDVIPLFAPEENTIMNNNMSGKELYLHLATSGRCSGLITVTREAPLSA